MKTLILYLLTLPHLLFGQNYRLIMDKDLEPYIEELVHEAESRGDHTFRQRIVREVKHIEYGAIVRETRDSATNQLLIASTKDKITGLSNKETRKIVINFEISQDTMLTKLTLWHEIGHLLKKDFHNLHTCVDCSDIMSEFFPSDLSEYYDKEFLRKKLDDYFCYLKGYGMIYQCSL